MKNIYLLFLFTIIGQLHLSGQCDPSAALTCNEATLLCGVDELDGYSCTTLSFNNPTGPDPLCSGIGVPNNTQWWAFLGNGKRMTIRFNINLASCALNKGIEAGILWECGGSNAVCNSNCNIENFSLSISTNACQRYYLWVDGCEADICDYNIQVVNGEAITLIGEAPSLEILNPCPSIKAIVCINENELEDYSSVCHYYPIRSVWSITGATMRPYRRETRCRTITLPSKDSKAEVCVKYYIGDINNPCSEATKCITVYDEIPIVVENDQYICWENHRGSKFIWHDQAIWSSCINPPCTVRVQTRTECIDYVSAITLLPDRTNADVYRFVCDTSQLPIFTEDGNKWNNEICDQPIVWTDFDYYNCDTGYNLTIEVYKAKVTLSNSCPTCGDTIILYSTVEDNRNNCSKSSPYLNGVWLNEMQDTIAIGDSVAIEKDGEYYFHLMVHYINPTNNIIQSCSLHDSSWHIRIQRDSLALSGDSLICQVDTSTFALPDTYGNACKIVWSIEGLDGQIITDTSKNASKIEVYWPNDNTSDGKICAEIVDTCSAIKKTCKTLKGCFITQVSSPTSPYWTIYPNPASEVLYIQGAEPDEIQLKMHDIQGNEISTQPKRAIGGGIFIDVYNFTPGIYFIRLSSEENSQVVKVLVL